jgi:ParB family chromosome partitioning protein
MKICDIKIGGRHREDLGDIDSLADSIKRVGLLHPPVVTEQGTLIAGERRLEAVKKLGRDEVPVTVAKNLDDIYKCLIAERDENECRLKMTPPESVALSQSLEPYERKAAAERKAATRRIGNSSRPVNFTDREKGEAKDIVAAAVGMSRPTLDKATKVMAASKSDPEKFGDLAEKMRSTGKVSPAYKEMVNRNTREKPKARDRPADSGDKFMDAVSAACLRENADPVLVKMKHLTDYVRQPTHMMSFTELRKLIDELLKTYFKRKGKSS